MSPLALVQDFTPRAHAAYSRLRGVWAKAAPGGARYGAYATLAAVALGGAMLAANFAHDRHAALAVAVAPAVAPAPAPAVAAAPLPPVAKPDPIAALTPAPTPVAQKSTARIDTTPTGAVAEPPAVKPKHKKHPKKPKELDSDH